ncbi:hypothetical protein ACLOJK_000380 [Asimina triloba]
MQGKGSKLKIMCKKGQRNTLKSTPPRLLDFLEEDGFERTMIQKKKLEKMTELEKSKAASFQSRRKRRSAREEARGVFAGVWQLGGRSRVEPRVRRDGQCHAVCLLETLARIVFR